MKSYCSLAMTGLAFFYLVGAHTALASEEIRTIATRPDVTETVLLIKPEQPPVADLVMFVGNGGDIGLDKQWPVGRRGKNFLFRSADLFVKAGFLVAVLDAPSDSSGGLWNRRTSQDHAEDVAALIALLRREAPAPVWLVGTSMGTLSAANAAARLTAGGPDGVVLTSSVTQPSRRSAETLFSASLENIKVPLLVVSHDNDSCPSSPPWAAETIAERAAQAPKHQVLSFKGGKPAESDPCEALSAHGYFGIEAEVVAAIADWVAGATGAKPTTTP